MDGKGNSPQGKENLPAGELDRMEARFRASEKKFSAIFGLIPDPTTITDIKTGLIVDLNEAAAQWFGRPRTEAIGMTTAEVQVWADPADRGRMLEKIRSSGEINDMECRLRMHTGEIREVLFSSRVLEMDGKRYLLSRAHDITERKLIEESLSTSEKMLQAIIDAEPECVKVLDKDANLILMNRAGLDMIQAASLDQVKGRCVCPLITSEYRPAFMDLTKRVFEGESGTLLFEMAGLAGRRLWLETHAVPLRNEKNEITALLGVTRDVTERKRVEEELREKERKYRALFESANDGIFINDDNCFTDCNQRGAEMYGLTKEEVIGRSPAEFAPERQPDGRLSSEVVGEKIQAALAGAPQVFEWRPLRADGRLIDVEVTLSRLDLDGKVCLQAIVRDITERRRTEQALRSSESRFRSIIENAAEGILVADAETRQVKYANPEFCRMLGYDEEELLALKATDLTVESEARESLAGFRAHAEGKVHASQRTLRRKDGTPIHMNIHSVPMELEGRPAVLGFFADVTAQLLLEEQRLKTQKLESLGTLAGGIAHDFNNLLQGVFGYISMAKLTHNQKEKSLSMLEQAEKALHQSVSLTTQLLTFSKGGKPLKKTIALRPVIEDAARLALSGSRAVFELKVAADLPAVEADAGQIGQVIQNIVLNADQSMPLGGKIELSARSVPAASVSGLAEGLQGELVELTVRDQGLGIPQEHLERIFDPYFTTKEKGSGLGLATSYYIVRNHGGAIVATSELGKGSVFTIYLPASSATGKSAVADPCRSVGLKGRILVMDDDDVVRDVVGALLGELGHEYRIAEHGEAAIGLYCQAKEAGKPFDVVVLDLTIRGGMGGAETLRKLKEIDPCVKAVVSSGYSDDTALSNYREQGFKAFLQKPYNIEELQETLNALLA